MSNRRIIQPFDDTPADDDPLIEDEDDEPREWRCPYCLAEGSDPCENPRFWECPFP